MTEQVEKLTAEVRRLTPAELNDLRSWLDDYQSEQPPSTDLTERRVDWSMHFEEVRKIWGNRPPLKENIVLEMRREERY